MGEVGGVSEGYAEHRPLLFSIAYRMTGSVSDAEDIVQEAFARLNSRQILARARRHVDEGKPRFEASLAQRDEVARWFFAAADGGDLDGLLRALAPDVVYYGDGGGKARAVAAPLHGRDRVARFLAGLFRRIRKLEASLRLVEANGQPGAVTYGRDGHVVNVFALDIADGAVQAIRCVVNPDKLRHLSPSPRPAPPPKPPMS